MGYARKHEERTKTEQNNLDILIMRKNIENGGGLIMHRLDKEKSIFFLFQASRTQEFPLKLMGIRFKSHRKFLVKNEKLKFIANGHCDKHRQL